MNIFYSVFIRDFDLYHSRFLVDFNCYFYKVFIQIDIKVEEKVKICAFWLLMTL